MTKIPKLFKKLKKMAVPGLAGIALLVLLYLIFPYPNFTARSANAAISSSKSDISINLFNKSFTLKFSKTYPFTDSKEIRVRPQTEAYDPTEFYEDTQTIRKRLDYLGEDLYNIEADLDTNEIVITVAKNTDTNDVLNFAASKGEFSATIEMVNSGITTEDIDKVAKAYSQYGEAVEIKFKDPSAVALKLPARVLSQASFSIDGLEIGSAQQGNLLEVNGENPILASTGGYWDLSTIKTIPLYLTADETIALLKYGSISESFTLAEERTVSATYFKPETTLLVVSALMLTTTLVLFVTKQIKWIFPFAMTTTLAVITSLLLVKILNVRIDHITYFATGLPFAILCTHQIKVAGETKKKLDKDIGISTAMISAWTNNLSSILWPLGIFLVAGVIVPQIRVATIVSVPLLTLLLLVKPVFLSRLLKNEEKS